MPSTTVSRRQFAAAGAAAAFSFSILPRHVLGAPGVTPPSGRLSIGCIGVGGQGAGVTKELASFANVNIAALCDVDEAHAAHTFKQYPGRPIYKDYRVMLEKEKGLDAVMVATPDHWHAPISLAAMRLGKRIEWDAAAMRAKNAPEAEALIRKAYRKGFELMGGIS